MEGPHGQVIRHLSLRPVRGCGRDASLRPRLEVGAPPAVVPVVVVDEGGPVGEGGEDEGAEEGVEVRAETRTIGSEVEGGGEGTGGKGGGGREVGDTRER